ASRDGRAHAVSDDVDRRSRLLPRQAKLLPQSPGMRLKTVLPTRVSPIANVETLACKAATEYGRHETRADQAVQDKNRCTATRAGICQIVGGAVSGHDHAIVRSRVEDGRNVGKPRIRVGRGRMREGEEDRG